MIKHDETSIAPLPASSLIYFKAESGSNSLNLDPLIVYSSSSVNKTANEKVSEEQKIALSARTAQSSWQLRVNSVVASTAHLTRTREIQCWKKNARTETLLVIMAIHHHENSSVIIVWHFTKDFTKAFMPSSCIWCVVCALCTRAEEWNGNFSIHKKSNEFLHQTRNCAELLFHSEGSSESERGEMSYSRHKN